MSLYTPQSMLPFSRSQVPPNIYAGFPHGLVKIERKNEYIHRVKALLYDRYGGPEVLRLREVPEPRPAAWECLVAVHAASINPADWKLMAGQWRLFTGRRFPRPIGIDFAGVVERAGPAVRGFRPGDRVVGMVNPLRRGSMTERLAVPAWCWGRVPPTLGLEEASGVPVAGSAEVTAVCSREKTALCLELGAARVIDYRRSEPLALRERFDLILDCASSIPFAEARRLLAPGRKRWTFLAMPSGRGLERLAELCERCFLRVVVGASYPLAQAVEAFREGLRGHATGKIVVTMA